MTVIADIDIWRAAHLLLKQHGKDAASVVAERGSKAKVDGDVEGVRMWKQIAEAMLELLKAKPEEGEHVN